MARFFAPDVGSIPRDSGQVNRTPTEGMVGVGFIRPVVLYLNFMKLPERKNIRLKSYDYSSPGFYFVTICSDGRNNILEGINDLIEKVLADLPKRFSGLKVDYFVIMPNHMHVIFILDGKEVTLSEVVRAFKALVSQGCRGRMSGFDPAGAGFDKSNPYRMK